MNTSASERIPQELIMAIVENIQDDKTSLKTFSLVCKAWTNPARDHLFGSLEIDKIYLEKMKASDIASVYTPFLRHLRLTPGIPHVQFWHKVILLFADFRTPRLRSLELEYLNWPSLSSDEQSTLLRRFELIVSLRLSLLEPDTSHFIATIICSFPHLQELSLMPNWYRGSLSGPAPPLPKLHLPERLSSLHIFHSYHDHRLVLEWLGSIPEQLPIRSLHLSMHSLSPQDIDAVNMLLKALGPSLEVFACDTSKDYFVDLTYNSHLRCIRFDLNAGYFFDEMSFAMSTLSRIGSRQLEQVDFHLTDSPSWFDKDPYNVEWMKLDAMLAGPQFATVKELSICPFSCTLGFAANLPSFFATLLPTCHSRDIISFIHPSSWRSRHTSTTTDRKRKL